MDLEGRILRGFLGNHPREAARVLERLTERDVEAALDRAEPEEIALVLAAMVPSLASRYLQALALARGAETLAALASEKAAELLRRVPVEPRQALLEGLDPERREPIERLLRYPRETAGSWMEPHFVVFRMDRIVEEAIEELRAQGTELRHYLYVVDDALVLRGVLSLRELVASPARARMGDVMRQPVQTLSARAGRTSILRHPGWNNFPSLPVVDEEGRIVGVFRYRTFQELKGRPDDDVNPGALGLALALGELFWWGAAGLFRGLERTGHVDGDDGSE